MKKILFSIITLLTLTLTSCKLDDTFGLLPSVTGSTFEALLVIEDSTYNSPAGEAVHMLINGPTPILPQPEPLFKVSRVNNSQFDNLLKSTRNIVFVEINPDRYTQAKITFTRDKWANTQAVVNVVAPDNESLKQLIETEGQSIVDFLVLAERNRMLNYLEENTNVEAKNRVNKKFGCNINILTTLNKYEEKQDFFWITNASATIRQDIVIYSTPYTSDEQLTHEAILARRDSVMKANMPGGIEGSYMGTEYRYLPPETRFIKHNDAWCAETRGLWKMQNGEHMGGPFVSLTRIDEKNNKIITVEGFVFAPSKDKRNPIRQLDAMLYSLKLPLEIK